MAYSYFKYEGDGSTTTFAIPFALGILKKEDVTVHVGDEQDSSGQPIYRTWDFLPGNMGMIKIDGTPPKVGEAVRIERTVSKTQLVHDFQKGEPLDELSLDESHEQLMMAVQEALDGRGGVSIVDLDMNGNVIRNVGIDKTDPTSAINYGFYQALEQKMDDSYVNADRAETAATNAEASELAAAESARQARLSEQAAKASETAAATSEGIASAAAAAAADDSAATADDRIHVDAVADEIKNLTVEATTLNPGQDASANYDAATGVLNLGIPKGLPGDAAIATPTSLGSVMPQTGDEDGLELGEDGKLRVRKASAYQRGGVLASVTAAANAVPQAGQDGMLDESWVPRPDYWDMFPPFVPIPIWGTVPGGSDNRRAIMPGATQAREEWIFCDGGSDGKGGTTPDLRGRYIRGASLDQYAGTVGGSEEVTVNLSGSTGATTLSTTQMPSHDHTVRALGSGGSLEMYGSAAYGYTDTDRTTSAAGGNGSHTHPLSGSVSGTHTDPHLAMNFFIKVI